MKKKWGLKLNRVRWVGLVLCMFMVAALSLVYGLKEAAFISHGSQQNISQQVQQPPHPSFLTQKEFYEVLAQSKDRISTVDQSNWAEQSDSEDLVIPEDQVVAKEPYVLEGTVLAGVVPHHLVAGSLIADFMSLLSSQEPELVVIVGPNHNNLGGRITTGFADWQTPEGLVETKDKVVQVLLEKVEMAVQDEQVLSQEHSIGSLMPLIKHYLPQAKVVPIIFHHDVTIEEVDELLAVLDPLLVAEKGVILASVDFSHYLTRKEAEGKDRFTLKVMNNFDYPTLFHLGNDHLDSPASLATVFRYGQTKGLREFRLLANTNSGVILQNEFIETTSYFTLVFLKSNQF